MVQDGRGLVHVGNTDALLSFDGARWQLRSMEKHGGITSLCVGTDGTIGFVHLLNR